MPALLTFGLLMHADRAALMLSLPAKTLCDNQAQQQLHTAQQARRRSDLTVRELSGLSDDIPAYRAIGKAYVFIL